METDKPKRILNVEQKYTEDPAFLSNSLVIVFYSDATSHVLLCDTKEDADSKYKKLMDSRGVEIIDIVEFLKGLI